jgi:hypothetical protein
MFADFIGAWLSFRRLDNVAGRNHIDHGSEYAKAAGSRPDGRED